ncbi:hypothetical protein CWS72_01650 [Telmatospirillum siberiense]|uniref:Uncharacterized protein n=1 Tax=Telmatospirillum siberiense TaxID=382514 RepID=A0A2N3Q1N5_9PROT|nr:hypothetical protein CWS72_01650 [Telmatospirillum siberiense]
MILDVKTGAVKPRETNRRPGVRVNTNPLADLGAFAEDPQPAPCFGLFLVSLKLHCCPYAE